jgi:predicted nuclease of predicted toxin-antitoxin system
MQHNWEIWLDSHFSPIVAKWLCDSTELVVKSPYSLKLYELNDLEIYQKAQAAENVILVSKDSDLPEIIKRHGAPLKLLIVKKGNCTNKVMFEYMLETLPKAVRLITSFNIDILELE